MIDAESDQTRMTAEQAAREILSIERRTGALVQRTAGLTWMLWSVVSAGIFVSYEALSFAAPSGAWAWAGYGLIWVPWAALGALASGVLWRTLAVAVPSRREDAGTTTALAVGIFFALVLGGLAVVVAARLPIPLPAWPTMAVGIAAAVVGGSGLTTSARGERTLWVAGGAILVALTLAVSFGAGVLRSDPDTVLAVLGPIASTALLFGGGLYTASR